MVWEVETQKPTWWSTSKEKGRLAGYKKFKWLSVSELKKTPYVWIESISQLDWGGCLDKKRCSLHRRLCTTTASTHTLCLINTAAVLVGHLCYRHPATHQWWTRAAKTNRDKWMAMLFSATVYSNVTFPSLCPPTELIWPTAGSRPPPREVFPHYSPNRWNIRQALVLIRSGDLLSSFVWTASHCINQLTGDSGANPTQHDPSLFT